MVYSDIEKYGFIGIIPPPKTKDGDYAKHNRKVRKTIENAILNNREFVQFALKDTKSDYLNQILGRLIEWILHCNEAYYYYKHR